MSNRVAVIGTAGVPGRYGGFETLAENLVSRRRNATALTVYCSAPMYAERPSSYKGARLVYIRLKANGVQSILYDVVSILHAVRRHDVLLILGVSGAIVLPLVRLFWRRRIVLNIDGLEWQRQKWGRAARYFLKLSERVGVRAADVVIADNAGISSYLMQAYGMAGVLIPYGGDHVQHFAPRSEDRERYPFLRGAYAFSVCRIEPENNIHLLLEAFEEDSPLPLVIVGNWDHSAYGRSLRQRFEGSPGIHLLGAIYDSRALNVLRGNAAVYVHGHTAGGTNPSLVEAMTLGLPIVAFDGVYNRATTEERALYFTDAADLRGRVVEAVQRADLGATMKSIADRRYRWDGVVRAYDAVLGNADASR